MNKRQRKKYAKKELKTNIYAALFNAFDRLRKITYEKQRIIIPSSSIQALSDAGYKVD